MALEVRACTIAQAIAEARVRSFYMRSGIGWILAWALSASVSATSPKCPLGDGFTQPVLEHQFEDHLLKIQNQLAEQGRDGKEGLFGPDSMMWKVSQERAVQLGSGRAILLQLAHPAIADAIASDPKVIEEPVLRTQKTLQVLRVFRYGTVDEVMMTARHLHKVHSQIQGQSKQGAYHANDPRLLFWVLATIWDSGLVAYEEFVRPLHRGEKEQYYEETKWIARLMGVQEAWVPANYHEFQEYMRTTTESLRVTHEARQMASQLFEKSNLKTFSKAVTGSSVFNLLAQQYPVYVVRTLPESLRKQYRLHRYEKQKNFWWTMEMVYRKIPLRWRQSRGHKRAMRRLRITK